MKNRKSIVALFLVIAILALGIGYAAITNKTLTINGNVVTEANADNFDVYFSSAVPGSTTPASTMTINEAKDVVTYTVPKGVLKKVGDTVTGTVKIKNGSATGISAKISKPTVGTVTYSDGGSGYYQVTITGDETTIASGAETSAYTVTVKLIKAPITDITGTFAITYTATPVQA